DAQVRQGNARALLFGLQAMLRQIDQYIPERAPALHPKLTDLGVPGNNSMMNFGSQMRNAMQQRTSESLATAASTAPPQMPSRLYQSAALTAVDEGNTDRALQLAHGHLDDASRGRVLQAVAYKRQATAAPPQKR